MTFILICWHSISFGEKNNEIEAGKYSDELWSGAHLSHRILDYSMLNTNSHLRPYSTLDYDNHPSPLSYEVYAKLLVNDLSKIIKK